MGELVVGRAADDLRVQVRDRRLVEHAAERARGEDVDVRSERGGRLEPLGAELVGERRASRVDVGDDQPRAGLREPLRERRRRRGRAPTTATLRSLQVAEPNWWRAQARMACSTPRAVNGLGSPEPPRSVVRPVTWLVDVLRMRHVVGAGADVLGRHVAAVEHVDGVGEVLEDRGGAVAAWRVARRRRR